jgi:hypothetical protein
MNVSLSKFCKDRNLAKTSVYRRCEELRISTSDGLTPEAVKQLEHEFGAVAPSAGNSTVSVEVGNHSIELSAPQLPQTYSLEGLRTGAAVSFEDPLAIAAQFLNAADGLKDAMQQDIEIRQSKVNQTVAAKEAIAAKRQELELEARLYKLQTQKLDSTLSNETAALQQQLKALQSLGKPDASTPQP